MRKFHHAVAAHGFEALRRQRQHFQPRIIICPAHKFQAYLAYFPELPAGAVGAEYAFAVIYFARARARTVFYDRQRNVGFEGEQSAVFARKSYDVAAA